MPLIARANPADKQRQDVTAYREYVSRAADSNELILNRSSLHASVIVECIFVSSHKDVSILTGELNPEVYGREDVIKVVLEFLSRASDAQIAILAEKPLAPDHPLIAALRTSNMLSRLDLRYVTPDLQKTYEYHFAVGDGSHFRFEASRESFEAVVHFGNQEAGERLKSEFSRLQSQLSPFNLK